MPLKVLVPEINSSLDADWLLQPYSLHRSQVFSELSIQFLHSIGRGILSSDLARIPAFTALGFWMRKSNLKQILKENEHLIERQDDQFLNAAGTVFHVCPSNVDTIFLYSLACSVLMGNRNVLRLSERTDLESIGPILDLMNKALEEPKYKSIRDKLRIVSYGHDEKLNAHFSNIADVRMIWGGDETVEYFQKIASRAKCRDLSFPNRVSAALLSAPAYLKLDLEERKELCRLFFNDAYQFDQKACSSPQHLYILSDSTESYESFKNDFFNELEALVEQNYQQDPTSLSSMKLRQASNDALTNNLTSLDKRNASLWIAETHNPEILESCGAGYFYLSNIKSLDELKIALQGQPQTLSVFGLSLQDQTSMRNIAKDVGLDRVVPVGKALDFHYIWDGYHLLQELSSYTYIHSL